ncbi:hypothetical protein BS78_09G219600 [Paspalum vaginatum]|nr:hypothetical protein BS78_09G219600 [Paspalum vaginatum]
MPKPRLTITVILVIFLLFSAASGQTAAAAEVDGKDALGVVQMQRHSRKLLTEIQDYDYGGSNSKHDPRRKPGNGH